MVRHSPLWERVNEDWGGNLEGSLRLFKTLRRGHRYVAEILSTEDHPVSPSTAARWMRAVREE